MKFTREQYKQLKALDGQHIDELDDLPYLTGFTFTSQEDTNSALTWFRYSSFNYEGLSNAIFKLNPVRVEVEGFKFPLKPATEREQTRVLTKELPEATSNGHYQRLHATLRDYQRELSADRIENRVPEVTAPQVDTDDYFFDFVGGYFIASSQRNS
ncbi:MAG: hypothetical protein DUD32_03680 [Lactobacillus sp.]|mgnify:FL=1|jgi:hypothetical protein|nr:MAG: hypothetical protein DUD32_03680 [Lactobacillus sp.]